MTNHYDLHDYATGDRIRAATDEEYRASAEAARTDGGAGVIDAEGRRCYCPIAEPLRAIAEEDETMSYRSQTIDTWESITARLEGAAHDYAVGIGEHDRAEYCQRVRDGEDSEDVASEIRGEADATCATLRDYAIEQINTAAVESDDVDHNDPDDLGGWVNATIMCADGTRLPYGAWLYADADGIEDAETYDEIMRTGWAIRKYDSFDLADAGAAISPALQTLWDAAADEDGCVESPCGACCELPEEYAARLIHEGHAEPVWDPEAEWAADLQEWMAREIEEASLHQLLPAVRALRGANGA